MKTITNIKSKIKLITILILSVALIGCSTTTTTVARPPKAYHPSRPSTDKELIFEWQQSLIKIKEWQVWYDIQIGSNHFYTNK